MNVDVCVVDLDDNVRNMLHKVKLTLPVTDDVQSVCVCVCVCVCAGSEKTIKLMQQTTN